jgi:hypothetical protein
VSRATLIAAAIAGVLAATASIAACGGGHPASTGSGSNASSLRDTPSAEGPPPSQATSDVPTLTSPTHKVVNYTYLLSSAVSPSTGIVGFGEGHWSMDEDAQSHEKQVQAQAVANCRQAGGGSDCALIPTPNGAGGLVQAVLGAIPGNPYGQIRGTRMCAVVYEQVEGVAPGDHLFQVVSGNSIEQASETAQGPIRGSHCMDLPPL